MPMKELLVENECSRRIGNQQRWATAVLIIVASSVQRSLIELVDHFQARSSGIMPERLVVLGKIRAVMSEENLSIDLEMIVRMTAVSSYADESIDQSVRVPMIWSRCLYRSFKRCQQNYSVFDGWNQCIDMILDKANEAERQSRRHFLVLFLRLHVRCRSISKMKFDLYCRQIRPRLAARVDLLT